MGLRPHQLLKDAAINESWDNGIRNILNVDACGSGKSVLNAHIHQHNDSPSCVIAHRQELVCQLSTALAQNGVHHRIIGPEKIVKLIVHNHMEDVGANFYDPSSSIAVAGVDTLIRRKSALKDWLDSVGMWSIDECHHLQRKNKWGNAVNMFSNAKRGLGLTATACRADKRGLGRDNDGLFDEILPGPSPRDLINAGYLTDYRLVAPTTANFNQSNLVLGANGEFTKDSVNEVTRKSAIIGDVVSHYLRFAKGKLGITFMPNCDIATDTAAEFNRRGVPAAVLTGDTPTDERVRVIAQYKNRKILQLVNVDLFGEGFDLPAIEVVQLARKTNSYSLCHQQFMRALRLMIEKSLSARWGSFTDAERLYHIANSEKPIALIIDHVCNINSEHGGHGLPDTARIYTLDRGEVTQRDIDPNVIPTRRCGNIDCNSVYERVVKVCPYCNEPWVPAGRSSPEMVDGDLTEIDALTLAKMRGEIEKVDMSLSEYRAYMEAKRAPYIHAHIKRHKEQQSVQAALRASMEWWAGYQRARGRSDDESYRRFYFMFGIDVLSAKALSTKETVNLATKINEVLKNEIKQMGNTVGCVA
jgi:superfamily II DNA or RNA helicase